MRILGFEITRAKALSMVDNRRGWLSIISEPFAGAWQRNQEITRETLREFFAIYSCITLITGDVGKLLWMLRQKTSHGIWAEKTSASYSPVLRKPNRYQNHIQFKQWWMTSKLAHGNTYVLKERNARGFVVAMYILDPWKVTPLVADDGSVYYQLNQDNLNTLDEAVIVPASEIIHDRYEPQFHPLIGVSPILAAALSGGLGLRIQQDSQTFFANGAKPGGILSAPGAISDDTAKRLKVQWDDNYSGVNAGKVAVVGDGLKYEPTKTNSVDSQLVEQLKLSAEIVCSAFHVPPFKIGFGLLPTGKVEDMNLIYYTDCLQKLIEEMELCLDEGLELPEGNGIYLDTEGLLRMDSHTKVTTLAAAVKGSLMASNEGRKKLNLPPVEGGDAVTAQQQDFSLAALAARDASDPFSKPTPAAPVVAVDDDVPDADTAKQVFVGLVKNFPLTYDKSRAA